MQDQASLASTPASAALRTEEAVRERYSAAAQAVEPALCCPVNYDPRWLKVIPQAVLDRDYGCGDPSRHVRTGETVLDLGSGGGKICFIASQVVGPSGRVIGVDMNDEMLTLANTSAPEVAQRVGYGNVTFKRGRIQDLSLDLDAVDRYLAESPVRDAAGLGRLEQEMARLRREQPLIASDSVDVVVSNCVLNLVDGADKRQLFTEIFRTLKPGGRAVISDIVSDEDCPDHLRRDPTLWSGCISGALREDLFLRAFEDAGFYGITILERQPEPWQTVEGIEFRSMTVVAYKGKEGPCIDQKHAVIYRGPFREVTDDDGHVLRRGERAAVCEKTFRLYSKEPYREHFDPVPPLELVPLDKAPAFACDRGQLRDPRETKGADYRVTTDAASCGPDGRCC